MQLVCPYIVRRKEKFMEMEREYKRIGREIEKMPEKKFEDMLYECGLAGMSMEDSGLVVFDMDDVMWNLNEKVSKRTGIPYHKFTHYSVYDNPNMTDKERELVLHAYNDEDTFRNIRFLQPAVRLINRVYHEHPEHPVHLVSNCATEKIACIKMPQLRRVLDLPENRIHLRVIDMATQSKEKKFPDNIFILVDDSPHNIPLAGAMHNIMPARLNNDVLVDGYLNGIRVDRPKTGEELEQVVMGYLSGQPSLEKKSTKRKGKYSVVGYDKDAGTYITYMENLDPYMARRVAIMMGKICHNGELLHGPEPVDWIEIWDGDGDAVGHVYS